MKRLDGVKVMKIGDIYRDNDKRFVRYVKILSSPSGWVRVRTCAESGEFVHGSRESLVDTFRFEKAFSSYVPGSDIAAKEEEDE